MQLMKVFVLNHNNIKELNKMKINIKNKLYELSELLKVLIINFVVIALMFLITFLIK